MTRNKIAANEAIFGSLDFAIDDAAQHYAAFKKTRWIRTEAKDRNFLVEAQYFGATRFGASRWIVHFVHRDRSEIFTIGFAESLVFDGLPESQVNGAELTALLFEVMPSPIVGKFELVEELGDACLELDARYRGHDPAILKSLFPPIRHFRSPDTVQDVWSLYFSLCLAEARVGNYWHDSELLESLETICELDPAKIPYKVLCRSIFDYDPSSFFLALYRCLEALYSYASTKDLANDLGLTHDWREVSTKIEKHLRWYPREEGAIERLFSLVGMKEIDDFCLCLGTSREPPDTLRSRVARSVYELRNACVHFRPSHQLTDLTAIDWNRLCTAMACSVLDVYDTVM